MKFYAQSKISNRDRGQPPLVALHDRLLRHIDPLVLIFRRKTEAQIKWAPFSTFPVKILGEQWGKNDAGNEVPSLASTPGCLCMVGRRGFGAVPVKGHQWDSNSVVAPRHGLIMNKWANDKEAQDCRNLVFWFVANFCFGFLSSQFFDHCGHPNVSGNTISVGWCFA